MVHNVIPCTVVENARVNLRTRHPDPGNLTANIDPPHFTPSRKADISLPSSTDPAYNWSWISKWTVLRVEGLDGWRFAQRWDTPQNEWVSNPATLSPISRAGLVSRRTWVRVMKRCPVGETRVDDMEGSENEAIDLVQASENVGGGNVNIGNPVRQQQTRANSMGARLAGLVAGAPKGK